MASPVAKRQSRRSRRRKMVRQAGCGLAGRGVSRPRPTGKPDFGGGHVSAINSATRTRRTACLQGNSGGNSGLIGARQRCRTSGRGLGAAIVPAWPGTRSHRVIPCSIMALRMHSCYRIGWRQAGGRIANNPGTCYLLTTKRRTLNTLRKRAGELACVCQKVAPRGTKGLSGRHCAYPWIRWRP